MRATICATLISLALTPAIAQADNEEVGDHPMVPALEGSEIITYEFTTYDQVDMTFGPREDGEYVDERRFEGDHTQLTYLFNNPDVSTLQVQQAYLQGLEDAGFETEFTGVDRDDELGRRFHRHDIFDRSRPSGVSTHTLGWPRSSSERDMRFIAASHQEKPVHVSVLIANNRREEAPIIFVDVVDEVGDDAPALQMAAPEPAERSPQTTEEIIADHDTEGLSADEIEEGIISQGRIAVRDILFEFDSDAIIDNSEEALATIADVLQTNDDLELLIVGHTDNVGDFEYNLNLSMQRAQAVKGWLMDEHGISADRLQAAGAGMMAPVATNRDEDGRSQNRRVELVEL